MTVAVSKAREDNERRPYHLLVHQSLPVRLNVPATVAGRTANDAWWAVALISDQQVATMGGNKGDRKSYKATSSAKAAEALAAKGAGTAGFGGYVTAAVASHTASHDAAEAPAYSAIMPP